MRSTPARSIVALWAVPTADWSAVAAISSALPAAMIQAPVSDRTIPSPALLGVTEGATGTKALRQGLVFSIYSLRRPLSRRLPWQGRLGPELGDQDKNKTSTNRRPSNRDSDLREKRVESSEERRRRRFYRRSIILHSFLGRDRAKGGLPNRVGRRQTKTRRPGRATSRRQPCVPDLRQDGGAPPRRTGGKHKTGRNRRRPAGGHVGV